MNLRQTGWGKHGGVGWARKNVAELEGSPFSALSHHLLSLLGSLYTPSPTWSPGQGFLRKEFVVTTRDQEHMWVVWPGVMTTAE